VRYIACIDGSCRDFSVPQRLICLRCHFQSELLEWKRQIFPAVGPDNLT
jgi:hypothetical protein